MKGRGFTLIELLASLALSALLMAALLAVVASLGRDRAAIERRGGVEPWPSRAAGLLRRDIEEAAHYATAADRELVLLGPLCQNPQNATPLHTPARVRYRVVDAGEVRLLVREQEDLLDRSNRRVTRSLVCEGVERFAVELRWGSGSKPRQRDELPTAVRVVLTMQQDAGKTDATSEPTLDMEVVLP